MKTQKILLGCSMVAIVGLLIVVSVSWWSDHHVDQDAGATPHITKGLVARGAYLAKVGDCAACHSIPGRPAFSGGLQMMTPIGAIYSTNITPDPVNGIGRFTFTDFDRAVRFGVSKGHALYPAMPFTSYSDLLPSDVQALFAYFKAGVQSAPIPNRSTDIVFPLSMRWPLTYWRWLFAATPTPFSPPPVLSIREAHGEYLVDGLGHCGECHTPRALTMQVDARTASDGDAYLSGAEIDHYFAPSLRSAGNGTLSGWNADELAQFFQTGANRQGIVFGSMTDVISHSTQYLNHADAEDIALYLKTVRGPEQQSAYIADNATHFSLRNGDVSTPGARSYIDNCAACHRPDGAGYERVFPRLAGNPVVVAPNPLSVVAIILEGSDTPRTAATPAQFHMPGFAWRLSDRDVADVATFIRAGWGNKASPVTETMVKRERKALIPNEQLSSH